MPAATYVSVLVRAHLRSLREAFRAMLRICEALRENTKGLLKANLRSGASAIPKRMLRVMERRASTREP